MKRPLNSKRTSRDFLKVIWSSRNSTDKAKQAFVYSKNGRYLLGDPPVCACDREAVPEVSLTDSNPGRVFYRCSTLEQCRYFQWSKLQPLTGANFEPLRNEVRAEMNNQPMTLRALLVKMIQHKCPHIQTTKSGSNGHTVKVRRMACNHLVEDRPRRQDEKAESRTSRAKAKLRANPSPSIPTSSSITSSQSEADLLEEYQHQVQNQRDRY